MEAHVYLVNGERLTDLLNDPRGFIPVKRESGGVLVVAKTQIVSLEELESENSKDDAASGAHSDKSAAPGSEKFDPYAMLRVRPSASIDEIRTAYKIRIKAVHPDTVAALDLDEDLAKAALLASQKVNYAYRKIMRDREANEANAAHATA